MLTGLNIAQASKSSLPLPPFPGVPEPQQKIIAALEECELKEAHLEDRLEKHGIDFNAYIGGDTLLHWAARYNCVKEARFLVTRGAKINARATVSGMTPLHMAASGDFEEMARFSCEQRCRCQGYK